MTEKIWAVHKVTGIISEVLPIELETIPALERATAKQVKAAKDHEEIETFGAVLSNGVIPVEPVAEETKVTTKDGADNG